MYKAHDVIWLQVDPDGESCDLEQYDLTDVATWCQDQINDNDVKYVRADVYDQLREQVAMLREALHNAATSLETIQLRSFSKESYLDSTDQMRGYAGTRAGIAREALAATEPK